MRVELQQVSAGLDPAQAILQNFSLRIEKGEHIALIGPSGAGKTTLLHLLGLALAPHAGHRPGLQLALHAHRRQTPPTPARARGGAGGGRDGQPLP